MPSMGKASSKSATQQPKKDEMSIEPLPDYYETKEAKPKAEPDNIYGVGEDDHELEIAESLAKEYNDDH